MYEKDKNSLKGKPRFPRFKKEKTVQEIIFTRYAIRIEGNKIKLSLSKSMRYASAAGVSTLSAAASSILHAYLPFRTLRLR